LKEWWARDHIEILRQWLSHLKIDISVRGGVVRLEKSFRTEHSWYARRGMLCVPKTSVNTLQMWCGRPSSWSDPLEWENVCLGDSNDWKVWQVLVNLAEDALKMVSLEELQGASICWRSKRTIAPHEWQRGWLLGLLPLMCSKWTTPSIDKCSSPYQMSKFGSHHSWRWAGVDGTILAYKYTPREQSSVCSSRVKEWRREKERRVANGSSCKCNNGRWELSEWMWSPAPCFVYCILFLSLLIWIAPMMYAFRWTTLNIVCQHAKAPMDNDHEHHQSESENPQHILH
jgi:hypothetical protein